MYNDSSRYHSSTIIQCEHPANCSFMGIEGGGGEWAKNGRKNLEFTAPYLSWLKKYAQFQSWTFFHVICWVGCKFECRYVIQERMKYTRTRNIKSKSQWVTRNALPEHQNSGNRNTCKLLSFFHLVQLLLALPPRPQFRYQRVIIILGKLIFEECDD